MKIETFTSFMAYLRDEVEYVIYIRNLKQVLSHILALKNVHRVIKFDQESWLKRSIYMNTDLRKKQQKKKKRSEKDFFKLMNYSVFGKAMQNVQKHRYIKVATTTKKKKLFGIRTKLSYYKTFGRRLAD